MLNIETINGEEFVRLAELREARIADLVPLFNPPVVQPPKDPDPVEPPATPWRDIVRDGQPAAPGWYNTLMPTDSEDAAYAHYWDGAQWQWAPGWFPATFGAGVPGERYLGSVGTALTKQNRNQNEQ
jgi:hypothetical protein